MVHPNDIDPDTGLPYPNYSSPALDTTLHDIEMDVDGGEPRCTNPGGHKFICTGTAYGGDDESYGGEGRCYCVHCGADGDG